MRKPATPPAPSPIDLGSGFKWEGDWFAPSEDMPFFVFPDTPAVRLFFQLCWGGRDVTLALADVLESSDVPHDAWILHFAAFWLRGGSGAGLTKHQLRLQEKHNLARLFEDTKAFFRSTGISATEAEARAAKAMKRNVEAIRKLVQRTRKNHTK